MQSKLGYLHSGPLTLPTPSLTDTSVLHLSIPIEEDAGLPHLMSDPTDITHFNTDTSYQDMFSRYL